MGNVLVSPRSSPGLMAGRLCDPLSLVEGCQELCVSAKGTPLQFLLRKIPKILRRSLYRQDETKKGPRGSSPKRIVCMDGVCMRLSGKRIREGVHTTLRSLRGGLGISILIKPGIRAAGRPRLPWNISVPWWYRYCHQHSEGCLPRFTE
jgi:hypothetical protein